MERKSSMKLLISGVLIGTLIGSPTARASVEYQQAVPSPHPIYVDGQKIAMAAFNINGNNYVKLRDIGKAVGMNVYWDNGVQVDSDAPYTGVAPASELPEAPTPPKANTQDVDALRQEIVDRTNALRREHGVAALGTDPLLTKTAQVRAEEMAATSTYSHTRPDGSDRSTVCDCPYTAENTHRISDRTLTYKGQGLAEYAVDSWANSEGHRKNMLNGKLSDLGVGLARGVNASGEDCWYCVQVFLYDGCTITWVDEPITRK